MAPSPIVVFLFAILVPSTVILAQESSTNGNSSDGVTQPPHPPMSSSASGPFDHFPFKPLHFDFSAFFPEFASAGGHSGLRHVRSAQESSEVEEHSREKRSVVRCNFFTQGGFRCTGCKTVRRCYPFGLATETTCGGFLPYCNNGICSMRKGSLCSSTTSTTASSSTSSDSSSSSASSSSSSSSSSDSSTSESSSTSDSASTQ